MVDKTDKQAVEKKRRIIYTVAILVLLLIFYWAYNHAMISVTVTNSGNNMSYSFTNQGSGKTSTTASQSTTVKKLVSKGSYQVAAQSGSKSYFAVVKTGGFLGTTHVNGVLVNEKNRKFVGENPSDCMDYLGSNLLSYTCGGDFSAAKVHVGATTDTPVTYIDKVYNAPAGQVEATLSENGQAYVILHNSAHQAYMTDSYFGLSNPVTLTGLSAQQAYSITNTASGFVAYPSDYSQFIYYSSVGSNPVTLAIDKPTASGLSPKSVDYQNDSLAVLYASSSNSEVVVSKGGHLTHYSFSGKAYTDAKLCGTDLMCLLGTNKQLDVYKTTSNPATLSFSIIGVNATLESSGGFLAVNQVGVLNLDLNGRNGYYEYTFGDYKFSRLQASGSGYIVKVTNNKNTGEALMIDQNLANSGSIDKQVAQLLKSPDVQSVSISGNFMYITAANLGPLVYNKALQGYDYAPAKKAAAAKQINSQIDALGINRSTYTISSNAF